jgi:hypothetical protein
MAGKSFIDEGVIRIQQVDDAAVLAHDALKEKLRLAPEGLPQVVIPVGKLFPVGDSALQVAQEEPLAGEISDQGLGPRVRQHPPHLLLEHRRVLQFPLRGGVQELVVRDAAPQEK